jgi:hypothetical protein
MNKRRILTVAMLALLLVAIAAPVYASYATSIMYTKFNLPNAWQDIALDQTYTHLTADIKVHLTFNVSGTWAKIYFANDTSGSSEGINLLFGDDGVTLKVYYVQEPSEVLIATGTYTLTGNVSTTRVVFSGTKLDVYTNYGNRTLQTKIVDGFSLSTPIADLRVRGTSTGTVQNGYVQVNVNTGVSGVSGSTTDIVIQFVPVIVVFAMLGMVLGMLKKFGKI